MGNQHDERQGVEYYLGLDIGTNSVGWAVTDKCYNLCRFKHKDMWGIRLFDEAETAKERRVKRSNRRRLDRKKLRIDLLQDIFSSEMMKLDPTFFIRLNESRLHLDDKSTSHRFPLFIEDDFSDIHFYEKYPTIYHLRKDLLTSRDVKDIRFIYLAIHHIIKYRGHFLIPGDLSNVRDFDSILECLIGEINNIIGLNISIGNSDKKNIYSVLTDKTRTKSEKEKEIFGLFHINDFVQNQSKVGYTKIGSSIRNIIKLMVGGTGDLSKIFGVEKSIFEKNKLSFYDEDYENEVKERLSDEIPEWSFFIDLIKAVYDFGILSGILQNEEYFSCSMVKIYETHQANLKLLKKVMKEGLGKKVYDEFFNSYIDKDSRDKLIKNPTYSNYIGFLKNKNNKISVAKCNEYDFYKYLGSLLEQIDISRLQNISFTKADLDILQEGCKNNDLLPLQRSKRNAVVPHQLHEHELIKILDYAEKYHPFLLHKDPDGITNREKIEKIFLFRVPYFVGPLSTRHQHQGSNTWIVRKNGQEGMIYPWNIEDVVDFEKSNQAFIERMTNKCTYLIGEDVLPKNSLLYSKFMVLNEINNIKIKGRKITEKTKRDIYNDLFKSKMKVSGADLLKYLRKDMPELQMEDLGGFDQDFKSSLRPYIDFEKEVKLSLDYVSEGFSNFKMVEDIIKWITIHGDNKKMIRASIESAYPNHLTAEQIKVILSLRYKEWGNLSKSFLSGIVGENKITGEFGSIMDLLWKTNHNLMQLLNEPFSFDKEIRERNKEKTKFIDITYDSIFDDLNIPPSVKRAVWQAILIVEEVRKIMKAPPKRIFIEMARGGGKNERTIPKKTYLSELYANFKEDVYSDLINELQRFENSNLNSRKLFLYFIQLGKCMYTGENIDLDELMSANSKWDKDHIFPQSRLTDDSLDNLVLVRKEINLEKSKGPVSSEIRDKMIPFWKELLEKKLISKEKYDRLTKSDDFTDEELAGFINRQLVETRQSTKVVAERLKSLYSNTQVIYVKSRTVSDFRKQTLKSLKSRIVNDYHHAKDAYLNIVVGNVYDAKFNGDPYKWLIQNPDKDYNLKRMFDFDVYRGKDIVWKAFSKSSKEEKGTVIRSIDLVKSTIKKDTILYTEYSYCEKGELFDATMQCKDKKAEIRLKSNLPTEKYGGYHGANSSYFIMITYDDKKNNRIRNLIAVPVYVANMLKHSPNALFEYLKTTKGYKNVEITHNLIKKNSLLVVDGYPMRIRGENAKNLLLKNNVQLHVDEHYYELIRTIEKYVEKGDLNNIASRSDIKNEELDFLYDILCEKLNGVYKKRPSNQYQTLIECRERYRNSSMFIKVKAITQILKLLSCSNETKADLSMIGGSKNAGSMAINKNTFGSKKIVLVNQSVTGLFENRVEL